MFIPLSDAEKVFYLDKLHKQTDFKKGILKSLLEEVVMANFDISPLDNSDQLMEILLACEYKEGHHLTYTSDNAYWKYNDCFWQQIPKQEIKNALLQHARWFILENATGSIAQFNNAVMNIDTLIIKFSHINPRGSPRTDQDLYLNFIFPDMQAVHHNLSSVGIPCSDIHDAGGAYFSFDVYHQSEGQALVIFFWK